MNFSQPRFLGQAPRWYATTVVCLLLLNVLLAVAAGPWVTGWFCVAEFIFTLALSFHCHPLAPGGLIALEAVLLGLTDPLEVYAQVEHGLPVILLLLFMICAVHFMRELLLFCFTRMLLAVHSPTALALLFCLTAAVLSAFLDALTVLAVVMTVTGALLTACDEHNPGNPAAAAELAQLRGALRGLLMHAAVGTALGGVTTLVGEPQNVLVAAAVHWDFKAFFLHTAPVSMPVLAAGAVTCVLVERLRLFGFGVALPSSVRPVLTGLASQGAAAASHRQLLIQAAGAVILIVALVFHVAEVGLIGLMLVILLAASLGITDEHELAEGLKGGVPFTALLVVFFAVTAVIQDQHLFRPVLAWVLAHDPAHQPGWLYLASGALSAISDNVFVASVYLGELEQFLRTHPIPAQHLDTLAVAINAGTNIPSIATPNGQAALLFLLTSALAPRIALSYARMVWMAFPYLVVTGTVGWLAVNRLAGG
ncbi:MAG TPA: SLC13 family permease [Steroidobacteraceae bacterium]|nr:SLC13 family permease [Steroidobacteraceae bacterium]